MILARALRLFLAAALFAAWQGALVHPLEHLDEHGGFVHVGGVCGQHEDQGEEGANALCDALAAVAACVAGGVPALPIFAEGAQRAFLAVPESPRGAPPPAYRSQAPPQFS